MCGFGWIGLGARIAKVGTVNCLRIRCAQSEKEEPNTRGSSQNVLCLYVARPSGLCVGKHKYKANMYSSFVVWLAYQQHSANVVIKQKRP